MIQGTCERTDVLDLVKCNINVQHGSSVNIIVHIHICIHIHVCV